MTAPHIPVLLDEVIEALAPRPGDVIVDATYTKILKPDPRAYEQVLAELGLAHADCVFVDDQKKNIEGAVAIGLPHVHFDVTRPAESYAQALNMLGL